MKDWFGASWREFFLPERLRAVDDHIFSDPNGLSLIKESEAVIDKIIAHVIDQGAVKGIQVYKKNGRTFKLRLKVSPKRLKLMSFDTHLSPSAIKKRIVIELTRSSYRYKPKAKVVKEGSIYYTKNGKSHVRSVQKSPFFQGLIEKLQHLDGAFDGHPPPLLDMQAAEKSGTRPPKDDQREDEEHQRRLRLLVRQEEDLPPALGNRLKRLVQQLEAIVPSLRLLAVEDRYQIKRMINEDIPALVDAYRELNEPEKDEQTERVYEALTKMELSLHHLQQQEEKAKTERFEHILKVNEKRYPKKEGPYK